MRAKPGDKLLTGSGGTALIMHVLGSDGHPPYIVKWLSGGNIAMVDPDQYARVITACHQACDSQELDQLGRALRLTAGARLSQPLGRHNWDLRL